MVATQVLYSVESGLLLLALCVLIGPVLAERLRVPGLVGLIAMGTVLGPNVLEWLRVGGFVATVGAAGLLYLMFLAGVELDLATFAANRSAALTFGLLTFAIPFGLSFLVGRYHLDFGVSGAALIGAMWASHTVVAYPEAKSAGLDRNRAVGVAVAATVITDVLALVILAVAASTAVLDDVGGTTASTEHAPLPLWAGLVLMTVFCLGVLPPLTRWAFARVWHSRTQRFVWMLAGLAAGGMLGLAGGIEGLVGAFLAGIGMNSSVPSHGELMERIEFVGSALLVPAFLVSVGLAIDPAALVEPSTLRLAGIFTLLVVVGKTLAAVAAGRLFRFTWPEIAIMSTLTIGQAAATLAIAQVGVATGLFEQEILDAAVVTVVATVLITSFGTRIVARRIERPADGSQRLGERILVAAPDGALAAPLAELVAAIARSDGGLITPFDVAAGDAAVGGSERQGPGRLGTLTDALTRIGHDTESVSRVGDSVVSATLSLACEQHASLIVVPLASGGFPLDLPIGNDVDGIGGGASIPCVAVRLQGGSWTRVVFVSGRLGKQPAKLADAEIAADVARRIGSAGSMTVVVYAPSADAEVVGAWFPDVPPTAYEPGSGDVLQRLQRDDLLVLPAHVVADAGVFRRVKLRAALSNVSVVVVGGPGRLRVSMSPRPRPLVGVVGTRS